jgi:hypothetical protein
MLCDYELSSTLHGTETLITKLSEEPLTVKLNQRLNAMLICLWALKRFDLMSS